jgi:hypothetical protein
VEIDQASVTLQKITGGENHSKQLLIIYFIYILHKTNVSVPGLWDPGTGSFPPSAFPGCEEYKCDAQN